MPAQESQNQASTLTTEGNPVEVLPVRQVKTLLTWKAPARVFKKRDREFWTTVFSIAFLLAIILFFVKEWLLIAVIIGLIFVYYVLSTVPPEEVEHQITTRGVRFAGRDYLWEEFLSFWFTERWGQKILNFSFRTRIPGRIELLLGDLGEKQLRDTLAKYLLEETPSPSFLDKASDWLSRKIPLEIGK